ncbi:MAG: GerAB/ArcD/ProY family transporter [Candidatus Limivicinus sp.]
MKTDYSFNKRQLLSLCSVMLLAPALRIVPQSSAEEAGRAGWISVLLSLPPLILYIYFLRSFLSRRQEGEGLGELVLRCLGDKIGRPALIFFALWFLVYGSFMLRSGADRMIASIYPKSSAEFFVITMGISAVIASLGSERTLTRTARLLSPAVHIVLLIMLTAAAFKTESSNLLPLSAADTLPALSASIPCLGVLVLPLYMSGFLSRLKKEERDSPRPALLWAISSVLLLFWLNADIIGSFGPELTVRLSQPFFAMVRNLVFFRQLERVDALVVSLWIFSDFILISVCIYAAQHCLRLAFGRETGFHGEIFADMSCGRWFIPLCGFIAILGGLFLAPRPQLFRLWSKRLIPSVNLITAFLLLPAVYAFGRKKGRI